MAKNKNIDINSEQYIYDFVGKNIKKYRKMRGLTQEQLADLVNYSPSFIANIESSTYQSFSLAALWHIAKALKVDIHDLCYDSNKYNYLEIKRLKYKCNNCDYTMDMPKEVIEVFEFIYTVGKSKEKYPTFTCPRCGGTLNPQKIDN